MKISMAGAAGAAFWCASMLTAGTAGAQLPSDTDKGTASVVLQQPTKHWVWVNDVVFGHMPDGAAMLVDGDSGRYLGTLSTGFSFVRVVPTRDGKLLYSPEIYFSRGTRGVRSDVISIYDAKSLSPVGEISIPPKRAANLPMMADFALTDDDRFLMVYNFNPGQSVTIADMRSRTFVRELETPGCALEYPTGPRSFFSVCGDGALALVKLDEQGGATLTRTDPIFDPRTDPVTEKAVRVGDTWYFVTYDSVIYPVKANASGAKVAPTWSLLGDEERNQGWRSGGLQFLAADSKGHLYAIMHQGSLATHKDPGKEVWVYDLNTHKRVNRYALTAPASSIEVTSDDNPLLFAISMERPILDVYDPASGRLLRSVDQMGTTPTLLESP